MSTSSKLEDCYAPAQLVIDSKLSYSDISPLDDINGAQEDDWKKADLSFRANGRDRLDDMRRFIGVKNGVTGTEHVISASHMTDGLNSEEKSEIESQRLARERNGFTDLVSGAANKDHRHKDIYDSAGRKLSNGNNACGLLPGCSLPEVSDAVQLDSKLKRVSEQTKKVSILREGLRTEEARLLVIKKLLDSQRGRAPPPKPVVHVKQSSTQPSLHSRQPNFQASPHVSPKGAVVQNSSANVPVYPSTSAANSKPVVPAVAAQPVQKFYMQVGNQLVPAPPPPVTASSNQVYPPAPYASQQPYPVQQPAKPVPSTKQTPEQKQSAAKTALRRQLEQTLLQIPPPHPPSADWKAVPNVNSMDFMMLVGLDEVVDSILDIDDKPTLKGALSALLPYNPRICMQCKVDFSPCWKSNAKLQLNAMTCERCFLQNVKKDLKAEHTSRLKSAFLKALKQEQEIEERIKAGEDVNIGSLGGSVDKIEHGSSNASPITAIQSANTGIQPSTQSPVVAAASNTATPTETRHHPNSYHHRHQVVQHYPHHTSLVHQLHQQHMHQQQLELEPPSQRHSSSRWHPYVSSDHRNSHGHSSTPHRQYPSSNTAGSNAVEGHPEYYVVHHPQHSSARWQRT